MSDAPSTTEVRHRAAYVVQIVGKRTRSEVLCDELPEAARVKIGEAAAGWRDEKYRVQSLQSVIKEFNLPGLAVVYRPPKGRRFTSAPMTVSFEPVEIDETHPSLRQLVEHAAPATDAEPAPASASRLRRGLIRLGIPATTLFVCVPQMLGSFATNGIRSWTTWAWIIALALVLAIFLIAHLFRASQWFIIPGGIVVRRWAINRFAVDLDRFVPADTLLTIKKAQQGWQVTLNRGQIRAFRQMTEFECVAVLGAWQSPLRTPEIQELVDLR